MPVTVTLPAVSAVRVSSVSTRARWPASAVFTASVTAVLRAATEPEIAELMSVTVAVSAEFTLVMALLAAATASYFAADWMLAASTLMPSVPRETAFAVPPPKTVRSPEASTTALMVPLVMSMPLPLT